MWNENLKLNAQTSQYLLPPNFVPVKEWKIERNTFSGTDMECQSSAAATFLCIMWCISHNCHAVGIISTADTQAKNMTKYPTLLLHTQSCTRSLLSLSYVGCHVVCPALQFTDTIWIVIAIHVFWHTVFICKMSVFRGKSIPTILCKTTPHIRRKEYVEKFTAIAKNEALYSNRNCALAFKEIFPEIVRSARMLGIGTLGL